jgi:hypothetical protein
MSAFEDWLSGLGQGASLDLANIGGPTTTYSGAPTNVDWWDKLWSSTKDWLSKPENLLRLGAGAVGGLTSYLSAREANKLLAQRQRAELDFIRRQNARAAEAEATRKKYDAPDVYEYDPGKVAQPVEVGGEARFFMPVLRRVQNPVTMAEGGTVNSVPAEYDFGLVGRNTQAQPKVYKIDNSPAEQNFGIAGNNTWVQPAAPVQSSVGGSYTPDGLPKAFTFDEILSIAKNPNSTLKDRAAISRYLAQPDSRFYTLAYPQYEDYFNAKDAVLNKILTPISDFSIKVVPDSEKSRLDDIRTVQDYLFTPASVNIFDRAEDPTVLKYLEDIALLTDKYNYVYPRRTYLDEAAMGGLARGGYVNGVTKGQDDKIPALLSPGEFVVDADTVSMLGDGNNAAGASALEQMRQNIRKHKRSAPINKIPPKAKSPEQYMKGQK